MAKVCVEKYGADLISVRLEGTHPEKGNRTPEQAVELVKSVLAAVDVPLIVTGHNHFDRNNEVLKAVAAGLRRREPPAELGRAEQLPHHRRRGHGLRPLRGLPKPDRRQHRQADEHPAHQHGPQAGADRDGPADRRHGLRHRIHLLGDGAHPPDRPERRHDAGRADDRFPRPGMRQDQGAARPRKRTCRSGATCASAPRCGS